MTGKTLLRPGDPFPGLIVNLPGGRTVHLPGDMAGLIGYLRGTQLSRQEAPHGTATT